MPGGPQRWTGLALAVGWGLLGWLHSLPGLSPQARVGARLRWPNDLMIASRKLAGILLEQNSPDTCIVGVGINIHNNPAAADPELAGITTRLCDWLPECPTAAELIPGVLDGIAQGWARMEPSGLAGMIEELNSCWGGTREVEIRPLDGSPVSGTLCGIDEHGAIVLRLAAGGGRTFPAHQIERMLELDGA
jgi:BirA family biotin operon repressor/biotin-[acetyl-CoA-carboxylase] ligase